MLPYKHAVIGQNDRRRGRTPDPRKLRSDLRQPCFISAKMRQARSRARPRPHLSPCRFLSSENRLPYFDFVGVKSGLSRPVYILRN